MKQMDRLQQQVDKNQTKLIQLQNTVANMQGMCAERHKISLSNKLEALEAEEKSFKQNIENQEKRIEYQIKQNTDKITNIQLDMQSNCQKYKDKFMKQNAEFTQMKTRILNLQTKLQKKQDARDQFWRQVVGAVVIFIILQFLSFVFFGNLFSSSSQKNISIDPTTVIQQVQK